MSKKSKWFRVFGRSLFRRKPLKETDLIEDVVEVYRFHGLERMDKITKDFRGIMVDHIPPDRIPKRVTQRLNSREKVVDTTDLLGDLDRSVVLLRESAEKHATEYHFHDRKEQEAWAELIDHTQRSRPEENPPETMEVVTVPKYDPNAVAPSPSGLGLMVSEVPDVYLVDEMVSKQLVYAGRQARGEFRPTDPVEMPTTLADGARGWEDCSRLQKGAKWAIASKGQVLGFYTGGWMGLLVEFFLYLTVFQEVLGLDNEIVWGITVGHLLGGVLASLAIYVSYASLGHVEDWAEQKFRFLKGNMVSKRVMALVIGVVISSLCFGIIAVGESTENRNHRKWLRVKNALYELQTEEPVDQEALQRLTEREAALRKKLDHEPLLQDVARVVALMTLGMMSLLISAQLKALGHLYGETLRLKKLITHHQRQKNHHKVRYQSAVTAMIMAAQIRIEYLELLGRNRFLTSFLENLPTLRQMKDAHKNGSQLFFPERKQ